MSHADIGVSGVSANDNSVTPRYRVYGHRVRGVYWDGFVWDSIEQVIAYVGGSQIEALEKAKELNGAQ